MFAERNRSDALILLLFLDFYSRMFVKKETDNEF